MSCTRSGWREPAVVSEPRLQKRNRDSPVTTTGRSLKRNAVASVLPNHGGLTPAAPGFAFASRRTMFDCRGTAVGLPNHGGLTPAAHANVRLCIANGALCSERTSCTRSGWRKPAVGNTGMLAREKRISATTLAHAAKSGWREPAVVSEPRLQKRNRDSPVTTTGRSLKRNAVASVLPNHGGLTPAALDFVFASRRARFDSRCTMFGSPSHGGLTPAALGKKGRSVASAASVA
jgi:hypothetical protein